MNGKLAGEKFAVLWDQGKVLFGNTIVVNNFALNTVAYYFSNLVIYRKHFVMRVAVCDI